MDLLRNAIERLKASEDVLVRVFRNSSWLASAKAVTAVLSIVYLAILTRSLGVEGYGQFVLVMSSALMLSGLLRVDTWQTIVKFGGAYLYEQDHKGFSSIAYSCIFLELTGSCLAALLLVIVDHMFGDTLKWEPDLKNAAFWFVLAMLFCGRSSAIGILRAHDKFKEAAFAEMAIPVVRTIGGLAVFITRPGIKEFWIIWAVAEFASLGVLWYFIVRRTPLISLSGGVKEIGRILQKQTGFLPFLWQTNFVVFTGAIRDQLVTIIIGLALSSSAAGLFRFAFQLANSINRITELFARPLFTELSRIAHLGQHDIFLLLLKKSLRFALFGGTLLLLLLVVFGRPLLSFIAGPEYLPAYPLLLLLGAASAIGLMGVALDPLLQSSGKARVSANAALAMLACIGIGLYIALPEYGAIGAALVIVLAAIFRVGLLAIFARREWARLISSAQA